MIIAGFFRLIREMSLRFQEEHISEFRIAEQSLDTLDRISIVDVICFICNFDFLPHKIRPPRKVVIDDLVQLT